MKFLIIGASVMLVMVLAVVLAVASFAPSAPAPAASASAASASAASVTAARPSATGQAAAALSAPVATAPVATAPMATAPMATAPMATAPMAQSQPLDGLTPEDWSEENRPRRVARFLVTQKLWNAWIAITSARQSQGKKTPPCNLILLNADATGRAYRRDMDLLFPQGRAHLPNILLPRKYYCTTANCARRVQYFGKNYQDGFIFLVFRWAAAGENLEADL